MRKQQEVIPLYLITGFLESGKTTLIRQMLEDVNFTRGQKTLILRCEEGIEELDEKLLDTKNAILVGFEEPEELTNERLRELHRTYRPDRVIMEYNTFWTIEKLGKLALPPLWRFAQVITLVDGTTFESYMNNYRKQMTDPMKEADMIMVNRVTDDMPISSWRRTMKAINSGVSIAFEKLDGSTEDGVSDEDLPYDMKADIIDISDEQIGIFYLDALDHPERYDGKTIRMNGQPFPDSEMPSGFYFFGRYAMTCCANDIAKLGWVTKGNQKPSEKAFIRLTARCQVVTSPEDEAVLMFHEISAEKGHKPLEEYVTFG